MTLTVAELIRKKRDGHALGESEIREFVTGYTAGTIPDYQVSALLMAIYFNGMMPEELTVLTDAMLHSGSVMEHPQVDAIKVDKHSTGGVGDKISICLAPAVAALGVPVPMISGRGLGHTGGTLDKLEAIPGFDVHLSESASRDLLENIGMFLIGQTEDLAPADRKLYALRDVTGTVESIPLISSSIMSKKLAEGIDALVLDVKFGRGAFMGEYDKAVALAETLVQIGRAAGKNTRALLTDMNRPIGLTVGNALETREAIAVMEGNGPADTVELTVALGAEMLLLGKRANSLDEGRILMEQVLNDGSALALFARCIELQGGDPEVCTGGKGLPTAVHKEEICASRAGIVTDILPREIAMAALQVGAGRMKKEDPVDHATGVELLCRAGDTVTAGQPLALLHHNGNGEEDARQRLSGSIIVGETPPAPVQLIVKRI